MCFPLKENAFLGMLIGTEYQVVEDSVKRLKTTLSGYLQKRYKRDGDYPMLEITGISMKTIEIAVRPTYRQANAAYPLQGSVRITTPLIYGEEEPGIYDCYLPVFNENFYCYDLLQLENLARHFLKSIADDLSPEELYRYAAYPKPQLEYLSLKVKDDPSFNFDWNIRSKPQLLERLAERYPHARAIQKNLSPLPEAAWEMDETVENAIHFLFQQKTSLVVCGPTGVGKSAVLRAAFRKMATLSKENDLSYTFWRIRAQRITATSKYLGEWQETLEELIWELGNFNGILWIEDIVELIREGSRTVENSVAAYMLPFIQSGKLQIAGEVTPQQLESLRRFLPGFAESMQVLEIQEMPEPKVHLVFEKLQQYTAQILKIQITEDALTNALRLLKRFYPYESFPGKGVRFLGECIGEAQLKNRTRIDKQDVVSQFIQRTGLPELFLRDELLLDQQELYQFFSQLIIGQDEAIRQLSDIVKVFKTGLNNPYKPITTLIFAGPTGVGKTASAKALAQYFFGKGQKQDPLIRIDMSEFQHPAQITRFLGAGSEPGKLVADVRQRPFAVLLLDEAEKAAPSIFDAFLTVMDEGMLVDAYGRVTNFRNCIIILTTNLGASNQRSMGYQSQENSSVVYQSAIARFFRPEFINRIDNVVIFNSLSQDHVRAITTKELTELSKREGFVKKGLNIVFTPAVSEFLAKIGFHEKYGARPLQRALEDQIVQPLAKWILKNPSVEHQTVQVDFSDQIQISVTG